VTARAAAGLAAALALGALAPAALALAAPALTAGAGVADVAIPPGAPLGGYGGFPRRALLPDVLRLRPYAFWFRPSIGLHDPIRARALVLEEGRTRMLWLAIDLVGIDPSLVADLERRLGDQGLAYSAILVSASHTHSGPGAYTDSLLFGFLAVDRLAPAVREAVLAGLVSAARGADARKTGARLAVGRAEVRGITDSRVQGPLDPELGVLRVTRVDGRPLAVVWNYAIHGTALGRENLLLSGDLMADASARLERALGVPALFVNGAEGDVSPRPRGWPGWNRGRPRQRWRT